MFGFNPISNAPLPYDPTIGIGGTMSAIAGVENDLGYVSFDFCGSGYRPELERAFRERVSKELECCVRTTGSWRPAAGPDLSLTIEFFAGAIAGGIVWDLLKYVFGITKNALISFGKTAYVEKVHVVTPDYDIVIGSESFQGIDFRKIKYQSLLIDVSRFVEEEEKAGRFVKSVSMPCELVATNRGYECDLYNPNRRYTLWKVDYKNSALFEDCVYDAANDCRIPLYGNPQEAPIYIAGEDRYFGDPDDALL